jgi:hypothetical protein
MKSYNYNLQNSVEIHECLPKPDLVWWSVGSDELAHAE